MTRWKHVMTRINLDFLRNTTTKEAEKERTDERDIRHLRRQLEQIIDASNRRQKCYP